MRKSKYLIAGVAAVALSVAGSGVAQAATFGGQSLEMTAASGKQDKKKAGPVNSLTTSVITSYTNPPPSAPDLYASHTNVYFPKDYVFNTTGLPTCENTPAFAAGTAATAVSLCGPAQIGTGDATIEGPVPGVTAQINAFNGVPSSGNPTILLHSESSAGPSIVLVGTLKNSDVAGFGKVLDVPVDLGPFQGVEAITRFTVTIPKKQLPAKAASSAKKKKKKKAKKYFISAKCSKKKWTFRADSTYNTGPPPGTAVPSASTTASDTVSCKQKASKKKKKK